MDTLSLVTTHVLLSTPLLMLKAKRDASLHGIFFLSFCAPKSKWLYSKSH